MKIISILLAIVATAGCMTAICYHRDNAKLKNQMDMMSNDMIMIIDGKSDKETDLHQCLNDIDMIVNEYITLRRGEK